MVQASLLKGLAAIRAATASVPRVTVGLPTEIVARFEGDARLATAVADAQEKLGEWKKRSEVRILARSCVAVGGLGGALFLTLGDGVWKTRHLARSHSVA